MLVPPLPAGLAVELYQLRRHVLPLTQGDDVNKIRHGLGVIHGGAAGDDKRRQIGPVGAVEGDARQIQHIENGGESHLIANGKGHDVKIGDRVAGLQGKEGHLRPAHLLLHVAPGGEHPLAPHAVHLVHDAIENAHAQVGHADFVGVGEAEGDAGVHIFFIFDDRVILAAYVAGGLLHAG